MTRAKQHLQLLVPQRFYVHQQAAQGDRHVYGSLSRFIPPQVEQWFDHGGRTAAATPASVATDRSTAIDLTARVRALF